MRVVAAFVLLGVLAGCGGTPKPVSPAPIDDAGRARLLVLTQKDLPGGWQSSKHQDDPVADREDEKLVVCIGAPDPATSQTADVFGDVFGQGAQTITSETVMFRTAADGTKAAAAVKSARALACAKASVLPVLVEQLRVQGISAKIRSIAVTRHVLPVTGVVSGFRVVVNLAASGSAISVHQDVIVLARGRAQVRATFVDVGVAFPAAFELSLVRKLAAKLLR
jgi:hypothetical protein